MSPAKTALTSNFPPSNVIADDVGKHGFRVYEEAIVGGVLAEMKRFWTEYFSGPRPNRRVIRGDLRLGEENFHGYTDNAENCLFRDIDFLWNPPTHLPTRSVGEEIHRARNLAQNFEPDSGFTYRPDRYGIYISTSCYPVGNGWMRGHTDSHKDVPILQYMLPITHKGLDYDRGGLYLVLQDGTKVDVDGLMKPGSVVFFDGRLKHGVDTIGSSAPGPGRIGSFAITTFFRTSRELPDLMRRVEESYFKWHGRIARWRGDAGGNAY